MSDADDTIVALSSGAPPCAIAIIRMSGTACDAVVRRVAGRLPPHRVATLLTFRDPQDGAVIDRGLLLRFAAGESVTGEDVAEFHVHGGRAVVARMLGLLSAEEGCRIAEPGEFSRRALLNGRLTLAAAEGLSDLLLAETESQRRAAYAMFDGALGSMVESWRGELIDVAALVEALIDMDEDEDVSRGTAGRAEVDGRLDRLTSAVASVTAGRPSEAQRHGMSVVIAGPPNSGKSSLLNMLVGREAALVTAIPGTTRDMIEVAIDLGGRRLRVIDTAGLRESDDEVERLGIDRAQAAAGGADIVLWTGEDAPGRADAIWLNPKSDLADHSPYPERISISAFTGAGIEALAEAVGIRSQAWAGEQGVTLNARQKSLAQGLGRALASAREQEDMLLVAECLKLGLREIDRLVGRAQSDDVLDAVFSRFCLGK